MKAILFLKLYKSLIDLRTENIQFISLNKNSDSEIKSEVYSKYFDVFNRKVTRCNFL